MCEPRQFHCLYKWKNSCRSQLNTHYFWKLFDEGAVLVIGHKMALLNHSSAAKLVNDLMSELFSVKEMETSTIFGKDGRKALDATKIAAMRGKYNVLLFKMKITSKSV